MISHFDLTNSNACLNISNICLTKYLLNQCKYFIIFNLIMHILRFTDLYLNFILNYCLINLLSYKLYIKIILL